MQCAVAVYPQKINADVRKKIRTYLSLAKRYHVNEVFTSIHLPELSLEEQVTFLIEVASCAQQLDLECIADVGGSFIQKLLTDQQMLTKVAVCKIDYLRLDYGYDFNQLKMLYHALKLKGFVINASMYTEKQIDEHLQFFYDLDPMITIKACHNFYVREESGLDCEFALSQSMMFEKRGICVYYCIPSFDHPRGPLYLGLPTIETHRHMPLDEIILDLMSTYHAQALLIADEWMSEAHFKQMDDVFTKKIIEIPVCIHENCSDEERKIICKEHLFRYDSNAAFLRSRSSREMAEYAQKIKPTRSVERKRGDITIDNERYLRYSGELQVVMKDAQADERVNVVAHVKNEADLQKLKFFREGIVYRFIES